MRRRCGRSRSNSHALEGSSCQISSAETGSVKPMPKPFPAVHPFYTTGIVPLHESDNPLPEASSRYVSGLEIRIFEMNERADCDHLRSCISDELDHSGDHFAGPYNVVD